MESRNKQNFIKILLFSPFTFLLVFTSFSQTNAPLGTSAKSIALGNSTTLSTEMEGLFGNQAGISEANSFQLGINSANYFLLSELNHFGLGLIIPSNSGNFGITINQYGISEFQEQKLGIAYGRKFGKKLSAGIQFDYFNIQTDDFGNKGVFTFEGGIQSHISKNWSIGFHLFSPAKIEITNQQNLPTIFKIGTSYAPSKNALFVAELEKDISYPIRFNGGIQYHINDYLIGRLGVRSNPTNFNFGIGTKIGKKINLDLAFSYHQILGFSPILSAVYSSKTRELR